MEQLYAIKYRGTFGFIKPWTAVRDSKIYSQQFLTPSIVAGIERKLFPELLKDDDGSIKRIVAHRLRYKQISIQKEQSISRGYERKGKGKSSYKTRNKSVLERGVMLEPTLWLLFREKCSAELAITQHICLCRNEDILYPEGDIVEVSQAEFDTNEDLFSGFELVFVKSEESFLVGYDRFSEANPMYGELKIVGTPIKLNY